MKEQESQPGDRASICGLLWAIADLADPIATREMWERNGDYGSYTDLIPYIFDDRHVRKRAAMSDGYLDTYVGFPADLSQFADALDRFDAWWQERSLLPDREILDSELWLPVVESAKTIIRNAKTWMNANCPC